MKNFFYLCLSFAGGAIGAYSFIQCGGVFANIQTGNLIKLLIGLVTKSDINYLLQCALPIVGFLLGVTLVKLLEGAKHFTVWVMITECAFISGAAFIPEGFWLDVLRSVILSLCAGIQLQGFHSLNGSFFAATMATNNMRSVIDLAIGAVRTKDKSKLKAAGRLLCMICGFCVGITVCALLTAVWKNFAALIIVPFLVAAIFFGKD